MGLTGGLALAACGWEALSPVPKAVSCGCLPIVEGWPVSCVMCSVPTVHDSTLGLDKPVLVRHARYQKNAIATLTMAENHIKPNSIGLQLQAECWYEQEEPPQAWPSRLFPLQLEHNQVTLYF